MTSPSRPPSSTEAGRVVVAPDGASGPQERPGSGDGWLRRFFRAEPLSRRFRTTVWIGLLVVVLVEMVAVAWSLEGSDSDGLTELLGVALLVLFVSVRVTWGALATFVVVMVAIPFWSQGPLSLGLALIAMMVARTVNRAFGAFCILLYLIWTLASVLVLDLHLFTSLAADLIVICGVLVGLVMRRQARRIDLIEKNLAEQERLRQDTVEAERRQIAAELHDVVAHGLTIIAMQSSMLEMDLEESERQDAQRAIGDAARQSLLDLRRMLSVLHGSDRAYGLDDQEMTASSAERMAEFVDRLRGAGFTVDARIASLTQIPRSLQLTLMRVAQESTTNILKHADPPAEVSIVLSGDADTVTFCARNELPEPDRAARHPASGYGLVGMRERIGLFGGTLTCGPDGGDWVVQAEFPRRAR